MAEENNGSETVELEVPGYGWTATEVGISSYFVIFLSLLALVLVLSKFLHDRPGLSSVLPEAGMTIIVGVTAGYLVYLFAPPQAEPDNDREQGDDDDDDGGEDSDVAYGLLSFSPTVFFVALLPPIIFNSGYHLKRELFFRHMTPIVLFACAGTAVSTLVIALLLQIVTSSGLTGSFQPRFSELLTFGSLISATDPVSTLAVFQALRVDPQLFYLVFGESVLNDAVGLVLFNACQKFVGHENSFEKVTLAILQFVFDFLFSFVGSLCLGLLTGILAALILKKIDMRQTGILELCLYLLVMYVPFFLAEVVSMSGIVTILFTGITAKRYAEPNLSPSTETEADLFFRVTAHLAETAIFLELGLSVFGLSSYGNFHWQFVLWAIFACLVGRAANVYPITVLFNRLLWRMPNQETEKGAEVEMGNFDRNTCAGSEEKVSSSDLREKIIPKSSILTEGTRTPQSRQDLKIHWNTAHMLWFSGLRGAVAYACAKTFPNNLGNRTPFVITTMVIVLVTVFLLGGTTEIALDALDIDVDVDEEEYMKNESEHLNFGLLDTFEKRYVCPYVIRDYGRSPSRPDDLMMSSGRLAAPDGLVESAGLALPDSRTSTSTSTMPQPAAADLQSYAGQQVEMTELDHLNMLRRMGIVSAESVRRKKSLYDYGSR